MLVWGVYYTEVLRLRRPKVVTPVRTFERTREARWWHS